MGSECRMSEYFYFGLGHVGVRVLCVYECVVVLEKCIWLSNLCLLGDGFRPRYFIKKEQEKVM